MVKLAETWGDCTFRRLTWAKNRRNRGKGGPVFDYICEKSGGYCVPSYCLGPDEDADEQRKEKL